MKHFVILIIFLFALQVSGCGHRQIRTGDVFVSAPIEDSLEQYIKEIGLTNGKCKAPIVAAIVVCAEENEDTTISICIQNGYPPIPPASFEYDKYVPPIEKGMCMIENTICCVKYLGLTNCPHLINEKLLNYDASKYKKLEGIDLSSNSLDRMVSVRPSEKIYKYYGRDSIRLIFRQIGPTEELYARDGDNELSYP